MRNPGYACLYPEIADLPERCTDTGVAAPLVGIIGSVQAMEVLKLLTGAGQTLEGRLMPSAWHGRVPVSPAIRVVWCVARRALHSAVRFHPRPRRSAPNSASRGGARPVAPPRPVEQTCVCVTALNFYPASIT